MSLSLNLPTVLSNNKPSLVIISPLPLASILDQHLRRNQDQDRIFGTLLGFKNELNNQLEIKNSFGVPYKIQGRGEINIDMDHHKSLLDLHLKVNSKEVVIGW